MPEDGQPPSAPIQPVPIQVSAPEVVAASQFSVSVQATEFLLAVGQSRLLLAQDGQVAGAAPNYSITYSLSPGSAKELKIILESVIGQYERDFGSIPVSPGMKELSQQAPKSGSVE